MDKKIYLDKEGYQKLLDKVDMLKQKLAQNGLERGEAYSGAVGDGWHDNFAFDEANRQENMILGQLRECYEKLNQVVIIEKTSDDSLIDLGDIVTVDMIYSLDDCEEFQFKLVGTVGMCENSDIELQEVSINSPLGSAVYHKKNGETVSYKVDNRTFNVVIKSKIHEEQYIDIKKKKK